ncbi:MAG: TlpA family protein disulfide reductase [Deltaproteobacteria bacterium]|nr:TlpA family protein disulfide reductase [Deltaproteobacteria bacterium]TLN01714.1 MAG: TlpA family protein disulfide reductase [bacterium]
MMQSKFLVRLSALLFTALFLCPPASTVTAADKPPLRAGDVSPIVALRDLNGAVVRFPANYRGKVVILHFWKGGCSSCREELPGMESLYTKYRGQGLAILAVNIGQRRDIVERLVRSFGVSYTFLLDIDKEMAKRYDVVALPTTYLIDRSGVIRYRFLGSANLDLLRKRVLSML